MTSRTAMSSRIAWSGSDAGGRNRSVRETDDFGTDWQSKEGAQRARRRSRSPAHPVGRPACFPDQTHLFPLDDSVAPKPRVGLRHRSPLQIVDTTITVPAPVTS